MKHIRKNSIGTVLMVMFMGFSLSGCSTKDTSSVSEVEKTESISDNHIDTHADVQEEIPIEFAELSNEQIAGVPPLEEVTQEILYNMTLDEFKALIYVYCPNYKEIYGVESEMTDELWESLRYVISYQLYGTVSYTPDSNKYDEEELAEAQISQMIMQLEELGLSYSDFDEIETDDLQMLALSFKDASDEDISKCLLEHADVESSELTEENLDLFRDAMAAEFQLAYKIRCLLVDYPSIDINAIENKKEE